MRGLILPVLLGTLACLQLCHCHQFFFMAAPNILRAGSEETIVIQAHEFSGQAEVQITVLDFPKRKKGLYKTVATLKEPIHVAKAKIMIPVNYTRAALAGEKQYVIIQASSPSVPSLQLEKTILISPHHGYIYIQTDMPIYTPSQTVNYRIFATNHKLLPLSGNVVTELQNLHGVTVTHDVWCVEDGLLAKSIQIPELISYGTWKIVARFEDDPKQEYVTEFEVSEYVLPTFDVQLSSTKKYFHINDSEIRIDIQATYVHNEAVKGHALATFGILHNSRKMSVQNSWQRVYISNGKASVNVSRATLEASFGNISDFLGGSIFVNVTVFSSGGDFVRAEKSGIKIVASPYRIQFIQTPHYFKPGMPFLLTVIVTNPDQSPAERVPVIVDPGNVRQTTDQNGIASMRVNSAGGINKMLIKATTNHLDLQESEQATISMTVTAYTTSHGNFLHTEVVKLSQHLDVSLHTSHLIANTKESIKYFTILLIGKGSIFQVIRQEQVNSAAITTLAINETPEMWPSFRIVTYYYVSSGSSTEIVADSVWVDMPDVCVGTLQIKKKGILEQHYEPRGLYSLEVIADSDAKVGLVAVDKAVYVLSKKNKLTQKKVWEAVDKNDIGCTSGSGKDSLGVFQDAGLDIATSVNIETKARTELNCPAPPSRKRRDIKLVELKKNKVNSYIGELRDCCEAGIRENPMELSCEQRKVHVRQGKACVEAFVDCCTFAETLQPEEKEELIWSRSDDEDIEDEAEDENEKSNMLRSDFRETWLWKIDEPQDPKDDKKKPSGVRVLTADWLQGNLPDSITTWELMAVSISKEKGICVSEPLELIVKKLFFVDLRLPFSVVRNEQVEIRAVLYNFIPETIKVRVTFQYNKHLCSAATRSKAYRQTVTVRGQSTVAVPYIVIPLSLENIKIQVLALVIGKLMSDGVEKSLYVVAEGQINKASKTIVLDPQGKPQIEVIRRDTFDNLVPGTNVKTFISIQGDILGETLLGTLSSNNLQSLIVVPYGCPEQNMIRTSPNVILTKYLDDTRQWDQIGVEHRNEAIKNIIKGYQHQEMRHRQQDHSYSSATWLTAYVVKIFAMASELVNINYLNLCKSVGWLIGQKQTADGAFHEHGTVFTSSMQGEHRGSEADASLTAFVLITLKESEKICGQQVKDLVAGMQKARSYLERRLPSLMTPYSVAITSYALALMKSPKANEVMDVFSYNKTYWPVKNEPDSLYTVEATAYALLQKLQLNKIDEAHKVAEWLISRRVYGGGYSSTQTTVVALQALTEYKKDTLQDINTNMNVVLKVAGRSKSTNWLIDKTNAYQERSEKVEDNKEITIEVTGFGKGTLTIMTVYHTLLAEIECQDFHLSVSLEPDDKASRNDVEETFKLHIRARYLGKEKASMTIIDIKMLTAFIPEDKDLKLLTNGIENYISQYDPVTTENNGSVIIYLNELSNTQELVISFRVYQTLPVGYLQPAAVAIYEYYDPAKRCTKFYSLPEQSAIFKKLCLGKVCKCAEEKCAVQQNLGQKITSSDVNDAACASGVDYVYKVRLIRTIKYDSDMYDRHVVNIEEIIKVGTDSDLELNSERTFISHVACRDSLNLEENEEYLIMGHFTDMWQTSTDWSYVLGSKTYILQWLSEQVVKSDRFNTLGEMLEDFSNNLKTNGCKT